MIAALLATLAWACALALCVPGLRGRPVPAFAALAAAAALLHLPLPDGSPLAALRGLFADPAVLTTVLLAALLAARAGIGPRVGGRDRMLAAVLGLLALLLFYPAALGLGMVDPYAWGYGGAGLALAAGALAAVAALAGGPVLALALTLALAGWRLQWLGSPNLWDYLIDPLCAFGGFVALLAWAASSAYRAMRRPAAARSAGKASEAR